MASSRTPLIFFISLMSVSSLFCSPNQVDTRAWQEYYRDGKIVEYWQECPLNNEARVTFIGAPGVIVNLYLSSKKKICFSQAMYTKDVTDLTCPKPNRLTCSYSTSSRFDEVCIEDSVKDGSALIIYNLAIPKNLKEVLFFTDSLNLVAFNENDFEVHTKTFSKELGKYVLILSIKNPTS